MRFEQLPGYAGIKYWCDGVELEDAAKEQLQALAGLPFIYKHLAVMPDCHAGRGSTVGTVIATKGAVIPAAVGVDIGCGMVAVKLSLKGSDLPDNLHQIRSEIEAAVPHGRTDNGGLNDKGAWRSDEVPKSVDAEWDRLFGSYSVLKAAHSKVGIGKDREFLGTLGTGNHFIELCLDEDDHVWVMLHSGSRGVGNRIGSYFISEAKQEMRKYFIEPYLEDEDQAYLVEHSERFDDYMFAVEWAQDFAATNRKVMLGAVLGVLHQHFTFSVLDKAVNCHHNYITKENHFGQNVYVTRKGAVRAREGDLGIIPGSMGTGSFIVRGKGNRESFCSCSHGAGRRMSRAQARREITLDEHVQAMQGIEARTDIDVIDESPRAYKDIGAVMAAQDDLVEIVHRLHQVLNVKG